MVNNGGDKWCVLGDFNSIKSTEERKGVVCHHRSGEIELFCNFIEMCGLIDLPLIGRKFTWYKPDGRAMSRLDRFLISEEWLNYWGNLSQWGLQRSVSDHCAVILKEKESNWGPKPFRMMRCWEEMVGYEDFVKKEWAGLKVSGWKGFVLKEKLKGIKVKLKGWHNDHFGNMGSRIQEEKEELHRLDMKGEVDGLNEEEVRRRRMCTIKLNRLSSLQCSLLWQKSRMKWLKEGDANSKFFHRCIQRRRKVNEILGLDFDGSFINGVEPLRREIRGYFENHFLNGDWERPQFGNIHIPSLGLAESEYLTNSFSEEEIKDAVWNCDSYKSPGPDGVNFAFIKQFWDEVKSDFIGFMQEFHVNGKLVRGSNSSFIVLIPKKDNPQKVSDFRPISLIGCMYKVLSKVLANRLRRVMHLLISDCQSAFIKGRQILDSIMIANEMVDDAKRKK